MTLRIAQLGTGHLQASHRFPAARRNTPADVVVVWDRNTKAAKSFVGERDLDIKCDLELLLARSGVTSATGTISIGPSDGRVPLRQGPGRKWVEQDTSPTLADVVTTGAVNPDHITAALRVTQIIEAAYESPANVSVVAHKASSA